MTEKESTKNAGSPFYAAYSKLQNEVPWGKQNQTPEQTIAGEFADYDDFVKLVDKFTKHPAFSFEDAGQPKEYDDEKLGELYNAIAELKEVIDTKHPELDIPDRIETILAEDEEKYPFNSNYSDVTARTAHGLLCGEGGNCAGFSEVCCLMLSLYGYEPTPMLSRLNKPGVACHYVTCFKNKDGKIEILDPERKRSCDEVEKQYSLTAYQGSMKYAVPSKEFSKVKIGGESGIGPAFDDFFRDKQDKVLDPLVTLTKRLNVDEDDIEMYEKDSTNGPRINLKANSWNSRKKELLDIVLSEILEPAYAQSLAFMSESEV